MCGLSGVFRWDSQSVDPGRLKAMTDQLRHRGPDDEGYYFSGPAGPARAGLGFRRLAIIDLTGGRQPMSTEEQRSWIVFNGEIYNFLDLREDLEKRGRKLLTRSDTEVILHLYELYGKDCVRHLRGMFAFAIWDNGKKTLMLARDRIGKKPLFYHKAPGALYFASEMKALLAAPEIPRKVRAAALPLYLAYQFVPGPDTILEGIQQLPPAHVLTCGPDGKVEVERYWKIKRQPVEGRSAAALAEELLGKLREATQLRLISDVPLGAFLSGGIDSSAVVGLMAETMSQVKTFSIGFEESDFSELQYARLIAKRFGTEHHEFVVKPEAAEILPKLAWNYDQPFADPSALPSYYVARETRKHVTVALNGDGGDENFGGYLRYQADRIFSTVALLPAGMRSVGAVVLGKAMGSFRGSHLARRIQRAASVLDATPHEFNFKLFCYFDDPAQQSLFDDGFRKSAGNGSVYHYFSELYRQSDSEEFLDQVLACDAHGYLPDCLLVKMDIASMSNSLEARSPFLDHKLIEFAAGIPARYKVRYGGGKWILKRALRGFLPDEVLDRRKMGFGVPLSRWFRGPLNGFLRETVLSQRARQRGYFRMAEVERLVDEHGAGARDHGYKLWALLMLELWHRAYIDDQRI